MDEIRVTGLDSLLSRLSGLDKFEAVKNGLIRAAHRVESSAKEKCPVDDGILQASITHQIIENEQQAVIGTNVEYGPYVEFGTGLYAKNGNGRKTPWAYKDPKTGEIIWTAGQHPQPFLQPALSENKEKVIDDIKIEIRKKIMEVCR